MGELGFKKTFQRSTNLRHCAHIHFPHYLCSNQGFSAFTKPTLSHKLSLTPKALLKPLHHRKCFTEQRKGVIPLMPVHLIVYQIMCLVVYLLYKRYISSNNKYIIYNTIIVV